MPIFASTADMQDGRFPQRDLIQLTDDAGTGAIDLGNLERALNQADNEINGYVAAKYKRVDAGSPVPALLTDLACHIARYRLFRHGSPTDQVQKNYDQAVAQLRDIARGTIKLDLGEEVLIERDGQILVESADRLFTRDSMRDL